MTFNYELAFGFATVVLVLGIGWEKIRNVDDDDRADWVRSVRASPLKRLSIVLVLFVIVAVGGEHYLSEILFPAIQAGGLVLLGTLLRDLVAGGIALSLGRHLTDRTYSAFGGGDVE